MRMRAIILAILVSICCVSGVYSQTHSGLTCEDAIPLGSEFNGNVPDAGTYWYLANTYDLPLKIQFAPADGASQIAPAIEVDFTCTPGVYDNPKLDSIINLADGWGYEMPLKFTSNLAVVDGHNEFSMSVPKSYRDILASFGLTENVTAYVKVTYGGAGGIEMAPDTAFSSCMDRGEIVTLGSTLTVEAEDSETHFVFPLAKWQDDSVRFIWQGNAPADVYLSTICDYAFDIFDDANKIYDVFAVQPNDTFKLTNAEIKRALDWPENNGGLYYMKIYSQLAGTLKVEHIPMTPPAGDATLLRYGRTVQLNAHDTAKVFAIPIDWTNPTEFISPTPYIFNMYVGRTHDFEISDAIADYSFHKTADGRWLGLPKDELAVLWSKATGNYLYVRFDCGSKTTVTPYKWSQSDCEEASKEILPGDTLKSSKNSTVVYRMYYTDWVGGDIQLKWLSNTQCPAYMVDTCSPTSWNKDDARVISYKNIARRGTWTITEAEWTSWANRMDPDGYIYLRIIPSTSTNANMVITSSAPAEEDPQCIPMDSVLTVTAWDSYVWRGTTYTESGTHSETVSHPEGCDTTFTLHLTIHTTSYDSYEATGCDSIKYHGKKYTASGVFTDTLFDAAGNRTIMTLNLTVKYATAGEETTTACDSLLWNGVWYKESGEYTYHTTNKAGCDSTATLHLTVAHSYNKTLEDVKACDSYVWGDTTIYDSGTYTRRFKSIYGCDSLVTLTVTIGKSYLDTEDVITAYDSYTWIDGRTYKKSISGPVWDMSTIDGCDSTISLNLTIRHLVTDTFARTLCATELPYEWFGKKYTESGIYSSDTIQGKEVGGVYMDTVHTVDLTVIPVSTGDTTATACGSFTWYGKTYTQSATPTHTFKNKQDCDSIVTLHLTINQPSASEETKRVCDSYEWNGVVYTQSGDYTFHTQNKAGCDSTATLHLTVNHASSSELTIEKCERYTSPAGHEYTESGTFIETITNKAGCDSTITIHLTILHDCQQPAEYDTVYFCRGFNKEHEERVSDVLIRRYLPYVYESPAEWDYMEGVMLQTERDRTLMDLARAETNLRNHYVGELTPIERIVWSVRYSDAQAYTPIEAGNQPQWIDAGKLAVQILFRCGEMYNNAYPMDTEMVSGEETNGRKILRNGQIIIIRNGQEYNLLGTKIQ